MAVGRPLLYLFLATGLLWYPAAALSLTRGSHALELDFAIAFHRSRSPATRADGFARLLPAWSNCSSGLTAHLDGFGSDLATASTEDAPLRSRLNFGPEWDSTVKVVNAGLGSTGTHTFFYLMCDNGIPAVHWARSCHVGDDALAIHNRIVDRHKELRDCAAGLLEREDARCSTEKIRSDLRADLQALIVSGVVALADTPYTDLLPELLALVPGVRVVQTLRDSTSWVQRRVRGHGVDVLCRPPSSESSSFYNILECAESALWAADAVSSQQDVFSADWRAADAASAEAGDTPAPASAEAAAATVQVLQATRLAAARYAAHNALVARTVPAANLRQICVWDSEDLVPVLARTVACAGLAGDHAKANVRLQVAAKGPGKEPLYRWEMVDVTAC